MGRARAPRVLHPRPSALRCTSSASRKASRAGGCAPRRGLCARAPWTRPLGPSPARTLLPQRLRLRCGLRPRGAGPAGGGPFPVTSCPGRRSTRRRRRSGQRAQRPCWAAAGPRLRGPRSLARSLCRPCARCRPLLRPARLPPGRLRRRREGGGRGRDAGTGRAQAPALRAALRRPGVGSPASRRRRRALRGDPAGEHLRQVAAAAQGSLGPTPHRRASGRGKREHPKSVCWGERAMGRRSVSIFHPANATKMAAAFPFP